MSSKEIETLLMIVELEDKEKEKQKNEKLRQIMNKIEGVFQEKLVMQMNKIKQRKEINLKEHKLKDLIVKCEEYECRLSVCDFVGYQLKGVAKDMN